MTGRKKSRFIIAIYIKAVSTEDTRDHQIKQFMQADVHTCSHTQKHCTKLNHPKITVSVLEDVRRLLVVLNLKDVSM